MKYRVATNAFAGEDRVWSHPNHTPYGIAVFIIPSTGSQFCLIKWEV